MGTAGSPNVVLDRAIARGSLRQVELAATVCERISFEQALAIWLVYVREGSPLRGRVAARLLERLLAETRCSIEVAASAASILAAAPATLPALAALLDALGLDRAAERVDDALPAEP